MGRRVLAAVVAVLAVYFGLAAQLSRAAVGLTVSVSGPSQATVPSSATFAITARNAGTETLEGVSLKVTFPPLPTLLEVSRPNCTGDGAGSLNCPLENLGPGDSTVVTVKIGTSTARLLHHSFTVTSSPAGVTASGVYDLEVLPAPPPPPVPYADIAVMVTPATPTGGLRATHTMTVVNLGPETAHDVTAYDQFPRDEQLMSAVLSQGSCAPRSRDSWGILVRCTLGDIAAGARVILTFNTRMPPNPDGDPHTVQAVSNPSETDPTGENNSAYATAVWSGRYWLCYVCGSSILLNGYELPGSRGFRVQDDDSVVLADGSVIRPNGTVALANGDLMLADYTIIVGGAAPASGPAAQPEAPPPSPSAEQPPLLPPSQPASRSAAVRTPISSFSLGRISVETRTDRRIVHVALRSKPSGARAVVQIRKTGLDTPVATVRRRLTDETTTLSLALPRETKPGTYRVVAVLTLSGGETHTLSRPITVGGTRGSALIVRRPLLSSRSRRVFSLAQVERAFKQAGVPFQQEARPNPNLDPGNSDVSLLVPTALRPHLRGVAFTFDAEAFHSRAAYVFDSPVSATRFLNRINSAAEKTDVAKLRIENLVYIGSRSKAVSRALRSLKLTR